MQKENAYQENAALEEKRLDHQHPWVGQQIRDLPLAESELVVLIRHADESTAIPHGDTTLRNGDTLVIRSIS